MKGAETVSEREAVAARRSESRGGRNGAVGVRKAGADCQIVARKDYKFVVILHRRTVLCFVAHDALERVVAREDEEVTPRTSPGSSTIEPAGENIPSTSDARYRGHILSCRRNTFTAPP